MVVEYILDFIGISFGLFMLAGAYRLFKGDNY